MKEEMSFSLLRPPIRPPTQRHLLARPLWNSISRSTPGPETNKEPLIFFTYLRQNPPRSLFSTKGFN